jgi:hypothetical protein
LWLQEQQQWTAMKLILDAVTTKCPKCGHADFLPPPEPLPIGAPLTCGQCAHKVYYRELADQIADDGLNLGPRG